MIGSGYWSIGIEAAWVYVGSGAWGWSAQVAYLDDGFANDDADAGSISTEGNLRTRYGVTDGDTADALTVVVDVIKADAERLGITWKTPRVFYRGDTPDGTAEAIPRDWRGLLNAQSDRLGWERYYTTKPVR